MAASGHTGRSGATTVMVDRLLAAARMRLVRLEPLAAATVIELGRNATDVVGGFAAWRTAGLPVEHRMSPT